MNNIAKHKNKGCSVSCLTIEGVKIFENKMIAEEFAKFYSELGECLAAKIKTSTMPVDQYLSSIPRTTNSLVLRETSPTEIENVIKHLPNKTSSGHDGISNTLFGACWAQANCS